MNNSTVLSNCATNVPYSLERFTFILIASSLALVGLICNCTLVITFVRMRHNPDNYATYLGTLAVCDALICNSYIFLMGADAVAQYYENYFLYNLWVHYTIPIYCLSHMVQLANPYILIAGTLERLMKGSQCTVGVTHGCPHSQTESNFQKYFTSSRGRATIIACIFLFSLGLKLSLFWEMKITEFVECTTSTGNIGIELTELKMNYSYHIFDFYILSLLQVFIPFIALLVVNVLIVRNTGRDNFADLKAKSMSIHRFTNKARATIFDNPSNSSGRRESRALMASFRLSYDFMHRFSVYKRGFYKGQVKLRKARYTMVVIVSSYLLCNSLNFIMSTMEKLRLDSLLINENGEATDFYTHSSDMTSFLLLINSSLRLFLYWCCDAEIRNTIRNLCSCSETVETELVKCDRCETDKSYGVNKTCNFKLREYPSNMLVTIRTETDSESSSDIAL